jgi:hypothetical protein
VNEQQALAKMVAPGTKRPGKWRQGVIQILITRACNLSCYHCTQGSNLGGKPMVMTPEQFEVAVQSLKGYWGVVGVFGGNPAVSPHFNEICKILRKYFPKEQCGLWCNNPMGKGKVMRETFNPAVSNLNVHLDKGAYAEFKRDWPESMPFGLTQDSRHSPVFVAMKDVIKDEGLRWQLISNCDINVHWSAIVGTFRGEVRAWFCEVAGAQAMLHQDDPDYPSTGMKVDRMYDGQTKYWWQLPMPTFAHQVRKHCHECSVPLKGYGELAQQGTGPEQVSATHADIYKPKRKDRQVQIVTTLEELKSNAINRFTDYLGNAKRK